MFLSFVLSQKKRQFGISFLSSLKDFYGIALDFFTKNAKKLLMPLDKLRDMVYN